VPQRCVLKRREVKVFWTGVDDYLLLGWELCLVWENLLIEEFPSHLWTLFFFASLGNWCEVKRRK
jgi:hypothetical protein